MDDEVATDGIELVEITDPEAHPDLVQQVFDVVLRPSFSTDELPSIEVLQRPVTGEQQTIIVALDVDGPAGAAVYDRTVGAPLGVLGYLATRPGERGRGLGGRLVSRLLEVAAAGGVELVLAEVHDPRGHPETEDEHPTARLRFYERHGAVALAVPWMQPRLSLDGARVRDMLLLALYAAPRLHQAGVPSAWLAEWTERFYVADEGAVPDDADYRALAARMVAAPTIELVPISQLDAIERLR